MLSSAIFEPLTASAASLSVVTAPLFRVVVTTVELANFAEVTEPLAILAVVTLESAKAAVSTD